MTLKPKSIEFDQVRTRLVEERVRRTYEACLGREILIHEGTAYVTFKGGDGEDHEDQEFVQFDKPVRARIVETHEDDLTRWTDFGALDPVWRVKVLTPNWQSHILNPRPGVSYERMWWVFGIGWTQEKGFETAPCQEWEFADKEEMNGRD